jgi:hypothetical protein
VHRHCRSAVAMLSLFLSALLFVPLALADDPQVTITRFQNLPNRLFYFEDTPVSPLSPG